MKHLICADVRARSLYPNYPESPEFAEPVTRYQKPHFYPYWESEQRFGDKKPGSAIAEPSLSKVLRCTFKAVLQLMVKMIRTGLENIQTCIV